MKPFHRVVFVLLCQTHHAGVSRSKFDRKFVRDGQVQSAGARAQGRWPAAAVSGGGVGERNAEGAGQTLPVVPEAAGASDRRPRQANQALIPDWSGVTVKWLTC